MNEQRYKVVEDLQGSEFGMGISYTIEQWQKRALEWCHSDDNKELAKYIYNLPQNDIMDFISEMWSIKFAPVDSNEQIDESSLTDYIDETLQEFYEARFFETKYYKGTEELTREEAHEMAEYIVVGKMWGTDLDIVSNGKRYFVLDGWNGEAYCDCMECYDSRGYDTEHSRTGSYQRYDIREIYAEIEEGEFETVGYVLC